jgi:hemolysin activation/secretion protein
LFLSFGFTAAYPTHANPVSQRTIPSKACLLASAVFMIGLHTTSAWAQNSSSSPVSPVTVTPSTLSPDEQRQPVRVEIPAAGALQPPKGAEEMTVTLGDVKMEGEFLLASQAIPQILTEVVRRPVSLSELYLAASKVEAVYAAAGYVLARVSVPPQELADGGTLRIVIIDGFIEKVDVEALPERVRGPVLRRVGALVGKKQITLGEIEEVLSLASDIPGLALRSTLVRGNQPGAVGLLLEGEQRLVTGRLGIDNELDPSLGRWGGNLQLVLNSPLGLGEQFYGFASSDYAFSRYLSDDPRQRVLGGGALLPVGEGRITLNPEATFATTTPDTAANTLRTQGILRRLTFRGQGIVRKTRRQDIRLGLTIEQLSIRNEALDFPITLNQDRYMAARLAGTYSAAHPDGARSSANVQLSSGLGSLGAISVEEATARATPFSRIGATPEFVTLSVAGRTAVPVGQGFEIAVSANAQTSFGDPVFRSEQFVLEGSEGLSAFVGGETAVDSGMVVRADLSLFRVFRARGKQAGIIAPYVFGAFGAGRLEAPTAVERGTIDAFNFGAGLKANLFDQIDLRLEYAHAVSRIATLDKSDRINVSAALRF